MSLKNDSPVWILIFGAGVLAGIILIVATMFQWNLLPEKGPIKMAYHELISVILTGIGVILAALAIFIGVLAVWGYSQFQTITQKASKDHLDEILKTGNLRNELEQLIVKHVTSELKGGELREILVQTLDERVDIFSIQNAENRAVKDPTKDKDDGNF